MTKMPYYLSVWLMLVAVLIQTGCSPVIKGSVESIRLAAHPFQRLKPTAASVAAKPYYQLQVNAPSGQAILILATVADGQLGWYGAQHEIVFTQHGLVVKTVGLPQNLDDSAFLHANPFQQGLQHVQHPLRYVRRMDWSPDYRYGVLVQARLVPKGMEKVDILGAIKQLRRFDEELFVPEHGVHMRNQYWVDPSNGFIWKSLQYINPDFPLELIQLRPYHGADA